MPMTKAGMIVRRSTRGAQVIGPPTEVIRPLNTVSSGGRIIGGSAAGVLADDSDATYITDPESPNGVHPAWNGTLGALTAATGRNVLNFRVTVRTRNTSGGAPSGTPNLVIALRIPGVTTVGGDLIAPFPLTVTDTTGDLQTRSGGGTFTEAEINTMTVDCTSSLPNGGIGVDPEFVSLAVTVTFA